MTKQFTYRNIEITVTMTGRGILSICGDKKYSRFAATTNDTEIIDFCDEDSKRGRESRRAAYNLLKSNYDYYMNL